MKSILVVDDKKTNLVMARTVLGDTYKVIPVISGEQALQFLAGNTCDLILLDIEMPEMNGFEVMEKIKENEKLKDIPIVFLTANSEAETETKCLEMGAMDFIAKPFVPAVMLSRIGRILELEDMRLQLAEKLEKKIQEVSDIKSKSSKDALTGLWNREYTKERVDEIIKGEGVGTLFMIDMDNFKAINDIYGHMEGDSVLKMFSDTMRNFSHEGDILCRIGGDEFVMFLNGRTDKKEVSILAGKMIEELCGKIEEKKIETNTSVSIGISQTSEDGRDFDALYNAADKALYYVKQNGKNSYHFFSEQKADAQARGSALVDLNYLREIMYRIDPGNGAYQLEIDTFQHIYNFIHRFIMRRGDEVQTVLFTVHAAGVEQGDIDIALEMLQKAIYISLRRSDVSTKYSSKQVVVVLMDVNKENGMTVAQRIIDCFYNIYKDDRVKISYDIAQMDSEMPAWKAGKTAAEREA